MQGIVDTGDEASSNERFFLRPDRRCQTSGWILGVLRFCCAASE